MATTAKKPVEDKAGKSRAIELKKCITPEFRVSFPSLFTPKEYDGGDAKYCLTMLFPKTTDLSAPAITGGLSLKRIIHNAIVETYGPDKDKWPKQFRRPFRDGNEKEGTEGYKDVIFVSATSKKRPGLVDKDLNPILSEEAFYAGCWARAEVIAFTYETKGNKGVSLSLQNVQKLRDDTSFSGRKKAEDVFTKAAGGDDADDYADDDGDDEVELD